MQQTEVSLRSASSHRDRVPLQDGVHLAQIEKLILLQVASFCPHGVEYGSCMTLREDKTQFSFLL